MSLMCLDGKENSKKRNKKKKGGQRTNGEDAMDL